MIIEIFCEQGFGFRVHLKSIFDKIFTLNNTFHNEFQPCICHISIYRILIVPDLQCIHVVLTQMWSFQQMLVPHYNDIIMSAMASQITSLTIVYSTIYSGVDQRKLQSSASLAFCVEFTGDRWIPRTDGQLRGKCFHLMTSSCRWSTCWSVTQLVLWV